MRHFDFFLTGTIPVLPPEPTQAPTDKSNRTFCQYDWNRPQHKLRTKRISYAPLPAMSRDTNGEANMGVRDRIGGSTFHIVESPI